MKRTASALIASALLLGASIGLAQHTSSATEPSVAISTAITAQRCSTDCGKADEPSTVDGSTVVIGCDWSNDEMADQWLSDQLVQRCDYRVTGEPCQEDELCALEQIRETGAFGR